MKKTYVSFLWHFHQPYYKDSVDGDFRMAWVRLHGVKDYISMATLMQEFPEMTGANGSRTEHHVFQLPRHAGRVAVIPAFSRTLCENCNRVRLTADGRIRNCLYGDKEYDLRNLLRGGGTDDEIANQFTTAMWNKHRDGWDAQKAGQNFTNGPHRESMTQIGG